MKRHLPERFAAIACTALVAVLVPHADVVRAFETPDTSIELFSRDGIFLAEDDRSSLLEALAAIASNFPASSLVDDDLREKAVRVAQVQEPRNKQSSAARRELAKGVSPSPTSFFDSLPAVSENLWSVGNRLSQPPVDPEERRLAVHLFELSLLTHPDPPAERLAAFARLCNGEPVSWAGAVNLERDANPSTARASSLFRRALGKAEHEQRELEKAETKMEKVPDEPKPVPPSFDPITRSLPAVRWLNYEAGSALAGTVSLTLRLPEGGSERRWLTEKTEQALLPLRASGSDLPLTDLEIPAETAAERGWNWPEGVLGEVRFASEQVLPGPIRSLESSATLPAMILIEGALKNREVNPDFELVGEADSLSGAGSLGGRIMNHLEAAAETSPKYVLVPEAAFAQILGQLREKGSLDLLFKKEFISFANATDATDRMLNPTGQDLEAASAIFAEIAGASQRMPLPELARNPSAQDRLRSLLAACPDHLSAKVMLEYGLMPPTEADAITMFSDKVHAIVEPLMSLEESSVSDGDAGNGIGTAFLKLRAECPPAAKNLLDAAEDVYDAAGVYLQFTNTTTSMATQKLRDTREAIGRYKAERSALGLEARE